MPIEGLDHVAITVADVEATVEWYQRVLGAQPLLLELWREGKVPVVLLQIGASRLSVHAAGAPAAPSCSSADRRGERPLLPLQRAGFGHPSPAGDERHRRGRRSRAAARLQWRTRAIGLLP